MSRLGVYRWARLVAVLGPPLRKLFQRHGLLAIEPVREAIAGAPPKRADTCRTLDLTLGLTARGTPRGTVRFAHQARRTNRTGRNRTRAVLVRNWWNTRIA